MMRAMQSSFQFRSMHRLVHLGGAGVLFIGVHLSYVSVVTQPESDSLEAKKAKIPLLFANENSPNVIYRENAIRNTVSVNIGNCLCYVGSRGVEADTINNTFDELLREAGQSTELYQGLHQDIDTHSRHGKKKIRAELYINSDNQKDLWKHRAGYFKNPAKSYEKINVPFLKRIFHRGLLWSSPISNVFIDVWEPEFAPHGNPKNMGMVYVVGPDCEETETEKVSKEDFLLMVTEVSKNIMNCLGAYNREYPRPEERIELARIRLCPTDIYHHPEATKQEVADHFFKGIINAMQDDSIQLYFEYNEGVFGTAFQKWLELYKNVES